MNWKVPYGFYRKNILKFYLLFFVIFSFGSVAGWFIMQKYHLQEMQAAGFVLLASGLILFILAPILFRKGIAAFREEYRKSQAANANNQQLN